MPLLNSLHQTFGAITAPKGAVFLRTCGLFLLLAGGCAVPALAQQKSQLPDGPGKEPTQRVCSACHGAEIVIGRGLTRDGWTQVVTEMIQRGAQGSEDDFAQIVDYLATNFPPKSDAGKSDANKSDDSNKSGDANKSDSEKKSDSADKSDSSGNGSEPAKSEPSKKETH